MKSTKHQSLRHLGDWLVVRGSREGWRGGWEVWSAIEPRGGDSTGEEIEPPSSRKPHTSLDQLWINKNARKRPDTMQVRGLTKSAHRKAKRTTSQLSKHERVDFVGMQLRDNTNRFFRFFKNVEPIEEDPTVTTATLPRRLPVLLVTGH